jgi:hypothetical protein
MTTALHAPALRIRERLERGLALAALGLLLAACNTVPTPEASAPPTARESTPAAASPAAATSAPTTSQPTTTAPTTAAPASPAPSAAAPATPAGRPPGAASSPEASTALYLCRTTNDGQARSTAIEMEAKVEALCRRHPEMGPCQYAREQCRRAGGRVFDASGKEITRGTEAEYDRKVLRVKLRS